MFLGEVQVGLSCNRQFARTARNPLSGVGILLNNNAITQNLRGSLG
jgi:hypothetical protein